MTVDIIYNDNERGLINNVTNINVGIVFISLDRDNLPSLLLRKTDIFNIRIKEDKS